MSPNGSQELRGTHILAKPKNTHTKIKVSLVKRCSCFLCLELHISTWRVIERNSSHTFPMWYGKQNSHRQAQMCSDRRLSDSTLNAPHHILWIQYHSLWTNSQLRVTHISSAAPGCSPSTLPFHSPMKWGTCNSTQKTEEHGVCINLIHRWELVCLQYFLQQKFLDILLFWYSSHCPTSRFCQWQAGLWHCALSAVCQQHQQTDSCSHSLHRALPCKQQLWPWQHDVPRQLCTIPYSSCTTKPKSFHDRPRHWCKLKKQLPASEFWLVCNRILWQSFALCVLRPWR